MLFTSSIWGTVHWATIMQGNQSTLLNLKLIPNVHLRKMETIHWPHHVDRINGIGTNRSKVVFGQFGYGVDCQSFLPFFFFVNFPSPIILHICVVPIRKLCHSLKKNCFRFLCIHLSNICNTNIIRMIISWSVGGGIVESISLTPRVALALMLFSFIFFFFFFSFLKSLCYDVKITGTLAILIVVMTISLCFLFTVNFVSFFQWLLSLRSIFRWWQYSAFIPWWFKKTKQKSTVNSIRSCICVCNR